MSARIKELTPQEKLTRARQRIAEEDRRDLIKGMLSGTGIIIVFILFFIYLFN